MAVALIRPLAWELPGSALKSKKRERKERKKRKRKRKRKKKERKKEREKEGRKGIIRIKLRICVTFGGEHRAYPDVSFI